MAICRPRYGATLFQVRNGLLPDGTKPLASPMLSCRQGSSVILFENAFTRAIHEFYPKHVLGYYTYKIITSRGPMS